MNNKEENFVQEFGLRKIGTTKSSICNRLCVHFILKYIQRVQVGFSGSRFSSSKIALHTN